MSSGVIAALVVFAYLGVVLYVGIFAFRRSASKEDFFLANRGLGTFVFLMSLFGSNMTAFAILGSSGLAYRMGIGVYGLMASISGLVIPLSIFLIGTRIWALGKKFGHMTQVQIWRDRWEMGHIGTVIFALQAVMLVPYIIIGVMGGGETLMGISEGWVPYEVGGAIVALVVMAYVFFGGMRGTAWVNTLQTSMFLIFGTIAFFIIAKGMGGFGNAVSEMASTLGPPDQPATQPNATLGAALTRHKISEGYFLSYMLIPLSSIMFPHIAIFCLTAKKMASFRKTVIFYPICIMAIWLPAVFLGAVGSANPQVVASLAMKDNDNSHAYQKFAENNPALARTVAAVASGEIPAEAPEAKALLRNRAVTALANGNADGTMLTLLSVFSPALLAGVLGAAIMACVMASDSQILALSTMWSQDVFAHYGGHKKWGERAQVWSGRLFVVGLTIAAYIIAMLVKDSANIFELAIQYAFAGYASMTPIMLGCLFWKRSTKWGALAATLWIAACLVAFSIMQASSAAPARPGLSYPLWSVGDVVIFTREYNRIGFTQWQLLNVVPMFLGACAAMWLGSILTRPPSKTTIEKYFSKAAHRQPETQAVPA